MSLVHYGLNIHDFNLCRREITVQNNFICRKISISGALLQIALFMAACTTDLLHAGAVVYAASGIAYAGIAMATYQHWCEKLLPYMLIGVTLLEGSLASLAFSDSVSVILPAMIVSLPLLVIGNLWAVGSVTLCCCLIHLVIAFNTKPLNLAFFDLVHLMAFGFLGLCAHYWVSSLRLQSFLKDIQKNELVQQLYEAHQRLQYSVEHDPLTQLLTRDAILKRMEVLLQQKSPFFVGLIDIDDFKHINDTFGHHIGDDTLRFVGKILTTSLREQDLVARFGGDEFLVVICDVTSPETARRNAERILTHLAAQKKFSFPITLSIGLAAFPASGKSVDELYRNADLALYQGKRTGKKQIVFYQDLQAS